MQEKIFIDLEKLGHKFSKIETDLEMPKNYLSRFKNPENKLPEKWINPLQEYLLKHTVVFDAPPIDLSKSNDEPLQFAKPKTKLANISPQKDEAAEVRIRELNAKINKDFGEGTVVRFGDLQYEGYGIIETGSLQLDHALGIGGLPRGRMVEIFGRESSGKTTIALCVIAKAQKMGLKCLLIDAENAFDPEYATALGVITEELEYCLPAYGEEGLEVADRKICSGEFGVVVIDSVAALVPKGELEAQMGDSKMGLHARLMSQACRKMIGSVGKTNTLLIWINQIRNKIGVQYWESPDITTGGMALQFYASVRLSVTRSTTNENSVMNGNVKEGNKTTVKVVKNKCAAPFRSAVFNILYGVGIDSMSELIELAIELKIIDKSGSWFSYNGSKLGQGILSVRDVLVANPEMALEIESKIKNFKP